MPLYEYVCNQCGKKTEVIQRVGEAPPKACPHCGGKLKKAISAPAIQFKGSGWYVTDYARGASGEGGGRKGDSESSGESKSEKSESAGKSEKVEKKAEKSEKSEKKKKASSD